MRLRLPIRPRDRRLPAATGRARDDRGSIPFALMLMLVGISTSTLLVPTVLGQLSSTREAVQRSDSLYAAQAGLDVAIGHIRAARDGTTAPNGAPNGSLAALPCGPLAGQVSAGSSRYTVSITYLDDDPQGHDTDPTWVGAHTVGCIPGGGTATSPAFAMLVSAGTGSASGAYTNANSRTLRATYTFQTINTNIAGGLIHTYKKAGKQDLCFDAGSGNPSTGAFLLMELCSPGALQQLFAYNPNLTLTLTSSQSAIQPLGMCLDADVPHAVGSLVRFEPCATTTTPSQQWSINDEGNFEGTTDGRSLDGFCFNVQNGNNKGSFVILSRNCRNGADEVRTFAPESSVGAGAAGAGSGQLVNFKQFGRCLDVTEFNLTKGYMIAWPCKQAPDPTYVRWNQRFALPSTDPVTGVGVGRIVTNADGPEYCLRSPKSTAAGQYVIFTGCTGGDDQLWTVNRDTGAYATSYTVVDSAGLCLSPTNPYATPPDLYKPDEYINVSKIVMDDCDGATIQKWNAPPNILDPSPVKDIAER